jgi:hypothetical protein
VGFGRVGIAQKIWDEVKVIQNNAHPTPGQMNDRILSDTHFPCYEP